MCGEEEGEGWSSSKTVKKGMTILLPPRRMKRRRFCFFFLLLFSFWFSTPSNSVGEKLRIERYNIVVSLPFALCTSSLPPPSRFVQMSCLSTFLIFVTKLLTIEGARVWTDFFEERKGEKG